MRPGCHPLQPCDKDFELGSKGSRSHWGWVCGAGSSRWPPEEGAGSLLELSFHPAKERCWWLRSEWRHCLRWIGGETYMLW